jgi:hypothetical protein
VYDLGEALYGFLVRFGDEFDIRRVSSRVMCDLDDSCGLAWPGLAGWCVRCGGLAPSHTACVPHTPARNARANTQTHTRTGRRVCGAGRLCAAV